MTFEGSLVEVSWEEVCNGIVGSEEDIARIDLHVEDNSRREEDKWAGEEDVEEAGKED